MNGSKNYATLEEDPPSFQGAQVPREPVSSPYEFAVDLDSGENKGDPLADVPLPNDEHYAIDDDTRRQHYHSLCIESDTQMLLDQW